MDKRQISRLNAALSVVVVLNRWKDSLPEAAHECQTKLEELIEQIQQCGRQQQARTGLSEQKAQALNQLADAAVTVAGALTSYGTAHQDDRLVAACRCSRTELVSAADAAIAARCANLHEEATRLVEELGKYKVTTTTLKALQTKIDAFAALQTSPRDGITRSAAATRQMAGLFHQLQLVLSRELDPLIAPFRNTEPALFNEYRVARKLVHGPTASAEEANKVVPVVTAAGGASPTVETKVA